MACAEIEKDLFSEGYIRNSKSEKPESTEIEGDRNKTIIIGRVSERPEKHYKRLKPIVDFVASSMKDLGITGGSVLLAKDNNEMIKYLKDGKVDWVTETPFSAILFTEEAGAEIILRRWKRGVSDYYCVFITRKDSDINNLDKINGKKIAFEDPGSTTAYLVPYALLKKKGFNLIELYFPNEKPSLDKVGYTFVHGEQNIVTWVYKGLADVGAYSNLDWENPDDTPESLKNNLKIIYKTNPMPRSLELARKDLGSNIKTRLKEILMSAHNNPDAREALMKYAHTTKFDEINGEAEKGLKEVREILNNIRGELK